VSAFKKNKYVLIILVLLIAGAYIAEEFFLKKKSIIYPNFGIEVPAGYTTHGIDVSHYQHDIDWKLVSEMTDQGQRISFAIVKATEGTLLADPYFKKNWRELSEYNLIRGAYLYFHPRRSGKSQAEFFMSKVNLAAGDLPPIIDIEETNRQSKANIQKALKECIETLERKYHKKPIIYTGVDFYTNYLGEAFDAYPLWAAHYEQKDAPRITRKWLIWQHNCKGRVNGIRGDVDFNVVNGSLFALRDICLDE
jgi:lysozyme